MDSLDELKASVNAFVQERDWDQFHSLKNLACSVCIEAAELLEHFQWTPDSTPPNDLDATQQDRISDELADVLIYLIRLSDKMQIDILEAARRKLRANAQKYPVDKSRGSSKKYTEL